MNVYSQPESARSALESRPLAGLRILDFTHGGAGPLLTKTLGDFGADVVKVESRDHLDFPRTLPPYANKIPGVNRSAYFTNRNSSKRSILLDLKHGEGLPTAKALAISADVIVNSFRGGVLEGLGLGYSAISAENPRVIHVSMPMTPTSGPAASHRGVGRTITGYTGIHALTGYEDGEITGPGTHFPDHAANPGHGLVAILAALHARRRTGRGACIELAQVHSTLQLLGPTILATAATGRDPVPVGNQAPHAPYSGALKARDGWFAVTIADEDSLAEVAELVGTNRDEFNPRPARPGERGHLGQGARERLAEWAENRGRAECVAAFRKLGLPVTPIEDARGVSEDYPELWAVGHLVRIPHPEMGSAVYNAPPIRRRDGLEPSLACAPCIGEHTAEVLEEWLGMDPVEVRRLHEVGAVEQAAEVP